MKKQALQIQQISDRMLTFAKVSHLIPQSGWIKAIRTSIGMSMQQLGNKLQISKQAVAEMEKREIEGSITLKSLREFAKVADMQLVYGFVPKDKSLETAIKKRAIELATQIVMRTANTMNLENQGNSKKRLETAIKDRAEDIMNEYPKLLWD